MGASDRTIPEEETASLPVSDTQDDSVLDVSSKVWEISLPLEREGATEGLYVYRNTFHLIPRSIGRLAGLKTLKFFADDVEVLPPEAGELTGLERLQLKVSAPGVSGIPFRKLGALKELELCKVPPRPSAFSVLGEIAGLRCLTKLVVCHFSIRYLPSEIRCLKKLEELDLSFNKLKNLPDDIAELSALKVLKVANNKLVDLPSGISLLRRLEHLDLSNNRLTSLTSVNLASMRALQYLNLQYNKLLRCSQIPSWICCNVEGNEGDVTTDEIFISDIDIELHDVAVQRVDSYHSSNGCRTSTSYLSSGATSARCLVTQRVRKGWKRRDYLQQKARRERLNHNRKLKLENHIDVMPVKMVDENCSCEFSLVENRHSTLQVSEEKSSYCPEKSSFLSEQHAGSVEELDGDGPGLVNSIDPLISIGCDNTKKIDINERSYGDDGSCITSDSPSSNKLSDDKNAIEDDDCAVSPSNQCSLAAEVYSCGASTVILKSKRHSDKDLYNPKPSKFHRPVEECSELSCKYSTESLCSMDDHLPDGFYDAGRDRPFMSLQDYEQSLCLESREVILLDRAKDEELDAIAFSAQMLMSSLKRSSSSDKNEDMVDNLQRASILALIVSDWFGGSDRSASVMRIRRAVVGSNKRQPFVCTCSAANKYDNGVASKQMYGLVGNLNFSELCEKSLQIIKETRNSNIVPIGTLRFGICRHRAVLMKYLCDRADPPIPCELVRGYLDFMPHAWNAILVRRGKSWVRMIVDACYPMDIREETDPEYICRYMPLSRVLVPLQSESALAKGCSFNLYSSENGSEEAPRQSVVHCKFGNLDAAAKIRNLEASEASDDDLRNFEYTLLGEVRILGALRKHSCIVEMYGHQLTSKWVEPLNGKKRKRLLQSVIFLEYVKGGSLKNYLEELSKRSQKHVPFNIALSIAKDVAHALVEVHSKNIIHRDIKSENVLIDLDCKRSDGTSVIKLSDFDRSVPVHSSSHTCCIAHHGIHPADVCVGTPRWMAPEVVKAMHQRNPYGLEVDIWSYGCLLLELLTLKIPYEGLADSELYNLLQMKQRPRLTPELEALASLDDPTARSELGLSTEADAENMKLLVDLFYRCTKGNPSDRPTARHIYDELCAISTVPQMSSS